jgi:hypothetical protein
MSLPPPPGAASSLPPPSPSGPPPTYGHRRGVAPREAAGAYYDIGLVILLSIVTFSIWTFLWVWRTNEDLQRYNGDGLGPGVALALRFLCWPVLMFTIPNEVKNLYVRDGRTSPVDAVWGLWVLVPVIGWIIWYVRVQTALNDFWRSKGARSA